MDGMAICTKHTQVASSKVRGYSLPAFHPVCGHVFLQPKRAPQGKTECEMWPQQQGLVWLGKQKTETSNVDRV